MPDERDHRSPDGEGWILVSIPVPVSHLSPSSLSRWEKCPRSWKHRYVDKLRDPPAAPGIVGTFVHVGLEMLYGRHPEERTQGTAGVLARLAWEETSESDDFMTLDLTIREAFEMKQQGKSLIQRVWEIEEPGDVEVLSTERRIEGDLLSVPFLGIIDRIDQEETGQGIVDYKSGKAPDPKYGGPDFTQLVLYAVAVEAADGVLPKRLS